MNIFKMFLTSEGPQPCRLSHDARQDSRVQISLKKEGKEGEKKGALLDLSVFPFLSQRERCLLFFFLKERARSGAAFSLLFPLSRSGAGKGCGTFIDFRAIRTLEVRRHSTHYGACPSPDTQGKNPISNLGTNPISNVGKTVT